MTGAAVGTRAVRARAGRLTEALAAFFAAAFTADRRGGGGALTGARLRLGAVLAILRSLRFSRAPSIIFTLAPW